MNQIKCPNCSECGIDYIYVGDVDTRIVFLQIWCNKCLKGIYVSRVVAPENAKFVTFDTIYRIAVSAAFSCKSCHICKYIPSLLPPVKCINRAKKISINRKNVVK